MEKEKPSLDQVIKYATPIAKQLIGERASNLPEEHRDEILQEVFVRVVNAYPKMDPDLGISAFTWEHVSGAVFDYLRYGRGYHEQRWSLQKVEVIDKDGKKKLLKKSWKLRDRVEVVGETDGDDNVSIDHTAGVFGQYTEAIDDRVEIDWELVAKMASIDDGFHAYAMILRGHTQEDIAPKFGACRTSAGTLIREFLERFHDLELRKDPWFQQVCRALGIARRLGIRRRSSDPDPVLGFAIGWKLQAVDLDDLTPLYPPEAQINLFDEDCPGNTH